MLLPCGRVPPIPATSYRCARNEYVVARATKVNMVLPESCGARVMNEPFNLTNFLPYQLAHLSERVSRRLSVEYHRSHGFSVADWRVLVHLQRVGTVSVRDIQRYTNLEKSRVSRAVTRLEKGGLLVKQASGTDARLVEIALTPKGRAAIEAIIPVATDIEAGLTKGLSADQTAQLQDIIEHIHRVLDADPDARPRLQIDVPSPAAKT